MKSWPSTRAFSRIELAVMMSTLMLLVVFLLFGMQGRKREVLRKNCVNNLKQVGLAYRTWALDGANGYPQTIDTVSGGSKQWLAGGQLFLHFLTMSNELGTTKVLVCPADKERSVARSFDPSFGNGNVSYFASLDAADTFPQVFLSGDRNLALAGKPVRPGTLLLLPDSTLGWTRGLHDLRGNIGLSDGSVQTFTANRLGAAAAGQGTPTNRLVFP